MPADRVQRLTECNEVAGDEPGPLVDQLIKGVLAVSAWLSPIDRPGLIFDSLPIQGYMLTIALHRELLQIGRETLQILLIGKNCDALRAKKVVVVDCQETQENGKIALKRSGAKMNVHLMEAIKQVTEIVRANCYHG